MKKNYKLQKKVTGAGDRCRWGKEISALWIYNKLSIVNCQLLIVNEISTRGLLQTRNYNRKKQRRSWFASRFFQAANHDRLYQKFLQGGPGGAVFSKSAPPGRRQEWDF